MSNMGNNSTYNKSGMGSQTSYLESRKKADEYIKSNTGMSGKTGMTGGMTGGLRK